MATTSRSRRIDRLLTDASAATEHEAWFKAERLAGDALKLAHQSSDYERMVRIIPTLQEARRRRLEQALEPDLVTVIEAPLPEDWKIQPGCYLIRPPQVGADARRLRLQALNDEVPVLVICREPLTQLKLCPIVAISPGTTVRTVVDPPEDDPPPLSWMVEAMQGLGDFAIESVDAALAMERRITALFDRLETVPEHEGLHRALETACREALHAA